MATCSAHVKMAVEIPTTEYQNKLVISLPKSLPSNTALKSYHL